MTDAVAGMRGGLGRILLTAFLLLAIVPLSVVSCLAVRRVQRDLRQTAVGNLDRAAASVQVQLTSWADAQRNVLIIGLQNSLFQQAVQGDAWADACQALWNLESLRATLATLSLLSPDQSTAYCAVGGSACVSDSSALRIAMPVNDPSGDLKAVLSVCPSSQALERAIRPADPGAGERVWLVDQDARPILMSDTGENTSLPESADSPAVGAAIRGEQGSAFYDDVFGVAVVGSYRWLPELNVALVIEQPQETALAREDELAAMLIGSTLAVALLTTLLAAVITRQLARPIVQLTVSAVRIANGDLDQRVEVKRRDEIGILAQAFNVMTAELRSLYDGLELKVAERTRQLVQANRQLRYQAMQLTLSAEVGRVATSILDLETLLGQVTDLVLESYTRVYDVFYVAVLLQDSFEEWVEVVSSSGRRPELAASRVAVDDPCPVCLATKAGGLRVVEQETGTLEVVVPLRIGSRTLGVLDLYCSRGEVITAQDLDALQSLGDQISVAIENARIYAAEREAVERLSRLDHIRLASLGVGSRELATELNTIIGFSRLILKEADGPLTELQRADLMAIHKSGYSLLGLIDNVITLSELESGILELQRRPTDLAALLDQVVSAARQRLGGVAVRCESEADLPWVDGDLALLRQAFLGLLIAATERVQQSEVTVRAFVSQADSARVVVHIGNGGGSLREEKLAQLTFQDPETISRGNVEEMSIALTLARQIIGLHGGLMELRFDAQQGLDAVAVLSTVKSHGQ